MKRSAPPIAKPSPPPLQGGLALVVVLWAAVLLALIAGAVTRLSRADLNLARNLAEGTQAEMAADSALRTAIYRIVNGGPEAWPADGAVYAWRFGDAEVRVRVSDELGRVDINEAPAALLEALFLAAGTVPDDALRLAEAVVEYRERALEEAEAASPDGGQEVYLPFPLTDALAQVPGVTGDLLARLSNAITVYTGSGEPSSDAAPPLVVAAIEGRVLEEYGEDASSDPPEGGGRLADKAAGGDEPPLSESPNLLGEPVEPMRVTSGLLRIEAEALTEGGAHYAREAVVALERRRDLSYRLRLWRRGVRTLFP